MTPLKGKKYMKYVAFHPLTQVNYLHLFYPEEEIKKMDIPETTENEEV
jgi:hypothetical protein